VEGQNETVYAPANLRMTPTKFPVEEDAPLPLVNVTVENVEGLFAWQVKVYFDAEILNITRDGVGYPENHVFVGKTFLNITPRVLSDSQDFYALFGSTLVGDEQSFTGSGVLCQLNFTGVSSGSSALNFSTPLCEDTYLLDADLDCILTEVIDNKQSGSITLDIDRELIYVYETERGIILSGSLTPQAAETRVIIYYRNPESHWHRMADLKTAHDGQYSFTWKPSRSGTYYLAAEWYGNENTNPAVSAIRKVSVIEPPPSQTPYLIAVLWIVIIMLVIYVTRTERAKSKDKA